MTSRMPITRKANVALVLLCLAVIPPLIRAAAAEVVDDEAKLHCHMLPIEHCAFSVDSDGNRCVLEKALTDNTYVCQTSDISVGEESPVEYVETDECIAACGAERMTVGFSTDVFSTRGFTSKLCSSDCREDCPNLADLYANMVAGEGTTIPELCGEHRRSMMLKEHNHDLTMAAPASGPSPVPEYYYAAPPAPSPYPTTEVPPHY